MVTYARNNQLLQELRELARRRSIDGRRSDHLANLMYGRMAQNGLRTICRERPWFHDWCALPDEAVPHQWYEIGAGNAPPPKLVLPSLLVVPVVFWDAYNGRWVQPRGLRPYWSGPVRIQDIGDENPDPSYWRDAHIVEGVVGVGQQADPTQNPGSMRCWKGWHQRTGQAFMDHRRGEVVANCYGSDAGHNRAYVFCVGEQQGEREYPVDSV